MEGRGLYAGANAGTNGASLYASWAENGGWNYGGGYKKQLLGINYDENSSSLLTLQLFELGNITLIGQLKADQFYLDNMKGMNDFIDDGGDDTFVLAGHGRIVNGIPTGEILINDKWYNAEALVELLPDIGYKPGQDIRLISCSNAVLAENLSKLMLKISVTGPTTNVRYSGVLGAFFGIGPWLKSNGTWNTFQNGKLIGVTKDE